MPCKICGGEAVYTHAAKILNKYDVKYYTCNKCGFHFTETPYWLGESYQSSIAKTDTGLVVRNLKIAKKLKTILFFLTRNNDKIVDISGGYGLLVRMMRDMGYDYYWEDKYSQNLHAVGFEAEDGKYRVATAFEVLEHLENPVEFIKEKKAKFNFEMFFFTTRLYKSERPKPDWDYYSLETGQHISFYNKKCLKALADKFDMKCISIGHDHLFYTNYWQAIIYVVSSVLWPFMNPLISKLKKSKTFSDHLRMKSS